MSKSLFELFRSGAIAPRVVLLPDQYFFVRGVTLETGGDAASPVEQVELALEGLAPFPLPQLYYGHHRSEDGGVAVVFAAYRRRFLDEQVSTWTEADLVVPMFCALLEEKMQPSTTCLYCTDEACTAVVWDQAGRPSKVLVRPMPDNPSPEQRTALRESMLREVGGTVHLVELTEAPRVIASSEEGAYVFAAGDRTMRLSKSTAESGDVRPREDLARHRRTQKRDLILWRTLVGAAAALVLLAAGEIGLGIGWGFEKTRRARTDVQRPLVERISNAQALAFRINELATNRLLPFEMLDAIGTVRPKTIQFVKVMTSGLSVLRIDAQTGNPGDVAGFQSALSRLPSVDHVEISDMSSRDRLTRFTLAVTFKPGVLKPAQS